MGGSRGPGSGWSSQRVNDGLLQYEGSDNNRGGSNSNRGSYNDLGPFEISGAIPPAPMGHTLWEEFASSERPGGEGEEEGAMDPEGVALSE